MRQNHQTREGSGYRWLFARGLSSMVVVGAALSAIGLIEVTTTVLILTVLVALVVLVVLVRRTQLLRPWLRQPVLSRARHGLHERGEDLERLGVGKALTELQFRDGNEGIADA